jgi:Fe-S-cluster containining protein
MAEWIKYKKGMCETCWASCCHDMPVEVSVPDLIRLQLLTEADAVTSLATAARKLKRQGWIRTFREKELIFVLSQKKNRDCIFLNRQRRCTVYENRPEICRQFPKIGPKPGHCPYRSKTKAAIP